ncbi:hypothetical protein Poli38472_014512 [Pythium oligandrum]|uniref:Uncharacterized protein n=1 Tax=Pythium oligandrum TaxID=41045 RepID=A0A8K1FFY3_PYTOL|nr:hypothetical protein Poli38472_014512 [Pythium oligandrum]|eukprot:TMW61051.1 hypothetical protein Poli38472_014512 [Pythium oligandrum]
MTAMATRLAACGDDMEALAAEISRMVEEGEEAHALVQAFPSETPWTRVATALATTSAKDEVIDALLARVQEDTQDESLEGMQEMTEALLRSCVDALSTSTEHVKTLLKRGETVMQLVFQHARRLNTQKETAEGEQTEDTSQEKTPWLLEIVRLLFRLHQEGETSQRDGRVVTFNLTKMSTMHAQDFRQSLQDDPMIGSQSDSVLPKLFEALLHRVAQSAQTLRSGFRLTNDSGVDGEAVDEHLMLELKLLRVWFRAFQGHFLCLVESLVAQVECSLGVVLDLAAALIPVIERHSPSYNQCSDDTQHDAARMLTVVLAFIETIASSNQLQASTRSFVQTLLWQSYDKLRDLVHQARSQFVAKSEDRDASDMDLEWATVLTLGAHTAICDDWSSTDSAPHLVRSELSSFPLHSRAATLLSRHSDWASRVFASDYAHTRSVFVDFVLSVLHRAEDLSSLQLFLVEQTLHPSPSQRFLMWEIWRQVMCFWWDDSSALSMLRTLISFACWSGSGREQLAVGVREEILRLIAFLFPEMSEGLKGECLVQVSAVIETICSDGPGHEWTPEIATKLDLFEMLTAAACMAEYDAADKEQWMGHYLPMAAECIGTVLELLEKASNATPAEQNGMIRVVDTCLLVVKAVLDDNEAGESGLDELTVMLVPMCAETLTQVAKYEKESVRRLSRGGAPMHSGRQKQVAAVESKSFERILQSCLYVLTRLSPVVKQNHRNQCVQALKDLLEILTCRHDATGNAMTIAVFMKHALSDVQVASVDQDVAWQLFSRVFHRLSALHFGLELKEDTAMTPGQTTCLEAFHAFLSQSNLPEACRTSNRMSVKNMLVPHAHSSFGRYLDILRAGSDALKPSRDASLDEYLYELVRDILRQRFPTRSGGDETKGVKRPRDEVEPDDFGDDLDDLDESASKRIKWLQFSALYWKFHERLSAVESERDLETITQKLSDQDLDQATSVFEQLLMRTR